MSLLKVYLGSKELKRTIVKLSFDNEIPLRFLCEEVGISYKTFLQGYINSNDPQIEIKEEQFEKILSLLGIERRVQFVILSDFNAKEVREKLENKHGREKKGVNTTYRFGDQGLG